MYFYFMNECVLCSFSRRLVSLSALNLFLSGASQLEEVRGVPASSEKAIADATSRKEEMEKQKVKEEEKLKEVMESLKEETSGLQQDKEVCLICFSS